MLGLVDNASQSILVLLSSNNSIAFGFGLDDKYRQSIFF